MSLVLPEDGDRAGSPSGSWQLVERLMTYTVITRTALSLADVRLRFESGAPVIGDEHWSSGFCNERTSDEDGPTEIAGRGDDPFHDSDARPPLLFMDDVTFSSVDALVRNWSRAATPVGRW